VATPTRNGPRPCGSGVKYKKCCLPKRTATPPHRTSRTTVARGARGSRSRVRPLSDHRHRSSVREPGAHRDPRSDQGAGRDGGTLAPTQERKYVRAMEHYERWLRQRVTARATSSRPTARRDLDRPHAHRDHPAPRKPARRGSGMAARPALQAVAAPLRAPRPPRPNPLARVRSWVTGNGRRVTQKPERLSPLSSRGRKGRRFLVREGGLEPYGPDVSLSIEFAILQ
jgi:hypothetical protein